MLAQYLVARIRKLLVEEDLSYRQISKRTGVSRGTIAKIASGELLERVPPPSEADDFQQPLDPPERCPTCGALVYPPCRLCQTRDFLRKHLDIVTRRRPDVPLPILKLNLKPHHRKRYEEVRRQRRETKAAG